MPDLKNTITTLFAIIGAILMGYERFDIEKIGLFIMVFSNFVTTIYSFAIEVLNRQKLISPFGIDIHFIL